MTFKIKLEDKAAFLNRMEKQGEAIGSEQIKDNKLEGYFEVTIDDPKQLEIVKAILKKSPKINTLSEMKKKLTKSELAEMVRQELQTVIAEKKKVKDEDKKEKLDENDLEEVGAGVELAWIPGAAAGLGITAVLLKNIIQHMESKGLKGMKGFIQAYKEVGGSAKSTIGKKMSGDM